MISKKDLDILFYHARTHRHWLDKPIPIETLQKLHELIYLAPTSANCCPLRIVYVQSPEAKENLKSCLMLGNIPFAMAAPVTAILAMDMKFYNNLPYLFPHTDAKSWFEGKDEIIQETTFRNSSLQGGYFILAARALGLDCGPMSGFDSNKVNELFLKDTTWKVNFICSIGYANHSKIHPRRDPRPSIEETTLFV